MQIRTKFSVASGIVILIVISFLSLSTYLLVESTLKEKTQAYVQDNASLLAKGISHWLLGKSAQISIAKSYIESDFSIDNFQQGLQLSTFKQDFMLMFGTLADEKILRSNNPDRVNPDDIDFRERAWYKLGTQTNEVAFTKPYIDAASKELILSVIAPIKSGGYVNGVIGGDLSLDSIAKSVNTINFNNTGLAFITDREGNIITHPDSKLNGKRIQAVYQQSADKVKEIIQFTDQGIDKLIYFYPLTKAEGMDWYLAVLLDKEKVYQSLVDLSVQTTLFAIISIALCIFILRKLAKHLLQPLNELESAIADIASGQGDLTQRLKIKNEDECGAVARNFNQFLSSLQQLVIDIKTKASLVVDKSDNSKELSTHASNELSNQTSLVENLATAMNEMSATSTEIASSAQDAASSITSVNEKAQEGQTVFTRTSDQVSALSTTIADSQKLSDELAQYSENIEQVLSVINGVAEQTNLLALNAAIEAARAGEQGRGFAVVADEVRTLASRTQESTTEIRSMIEQIQNSSGLVQQSMNQSMEKATTCVEDTVLAHKMLEEISSSVTDIMDRNIQIAAAIEQQSVVIEEINKNTNHINDISIQVTEFSNQQYQTNEGLVDEVNQQQALLEKFTV